MLQDDFDDVDDPDGTIVADLQADDLAEDDSESDVTEDLHETENQQN